jgi:CcmD family protein
MRLLRVLTLLAALVAIPAARPSTAMAANQPQPPKEFVPVDEVPPGEQIPAINMVAAAYGFVWVAVLVYVWSIAKRLKQVESELADLETRRK